MLVWQARATFLQNTDNSSFTRPKRGVWEIQPLGNSRPQNLFPHSNWTFLWPARLDVWPASRHALLSPLTLQIFVAIMVAKGTVTSEYILKTLAPRTGVPFHYYSQSQSLDNLNAEQGNLYDWVGICSFMLWWILVFNHIELYDDFIHLKIVSMVVVSCRTPSPSHKPIAPPMLDRKPEKENSGKKYSVVLTTWSKAKFMLEWRQTTLVFEISTPLI